MQSLSIKVKEGRQLNHSSCLKKKFNWRCCLGSTGVTEPSRDYHPQFLTFDFYLTTHLYNLKEWRQQTWRDVQLKFYQVGRLCQLPSLEMEPCTARKWWEIGYSHKWLICLKIRARNHGINVVLQLGCIAHFPPALWQQRHASFSRDKKFLLKSLYNLEAKHPRDLGRRGGTAIIRKPSYNFRLIWFLFQTSHQPSSHGQMYLPLSSADMEREPRYWDA